MALSRHGGVLFNSSGERATFIASAALLVGYAALTAITARRS